MQTAEDAENAEDYLVTTETRRHGEFGIGK
jgi:hypothetical protein